MKYEVQGIEYNVEIIRKRNKNTYIRVKNDMTIYVTTSYLTPNSFIKNLLDNNYSFLCKAINQKCKTKEKEGKFYLFGKSYDIIVDSSIKNIEIKGNQLFIPSEQFLNKWLKKELFKLYKEHIDKYYNLFKEDIPYPKLKIRNMKTRWGVNNKRDNSVTLNSRLIEFDLEKLDYVIVHELSHFVHFDHSKAFWETVAQYCPNYKQIRKDMKE